MDLMLQVTDWLAWPRRFSEQHLASEEVLGTLALAAADLEHQSSLVVPRESLWAELAFSVSSVPPQFAHMDADTPFARWLVIASFAEISSAPRLATLVVNQLETLVRRESVNATDAPSRAALNEQLALCWSRRGRIARISGQMADASHWYRKALILVRSLKVSDAKPQAMLGLAALAINRGNYPAVVRTLHGLTKRGAHLHALYRIPSHQLLAVARRKQGRFVDALLHVWAAFELLDAKDFRREQLIGTMAEIALEAGDIDAAVSGFAVVLHSTVGPLVRVPALYGAVRARIMHLKHGDKGTYGSTVPRQRRTDAQLAALGEQVRTLSASALPPNEAVLMHLSMAEIGLFLRETALAHEALDAAEAIACSVGLFERRFMIEGLRRRLHESSNADDAKSGAPNALQVNVATVRRRHPALDRLLSLRQ